MFKMIIVSFQDLTCFVTRRKYERLLYVFALWGLHEAEGAGRMRVQCSSQLRFEVQL